MNENISTILKTLLNTYSLFQLDMDEKKLEENLHALLEDVNSVRPKRDGLFITRLINE